MAIGLKTQAITWPLPFMLQLISLRLNVLFLYFSYVQYLKIYINLNHIIFSKIIPKNINVLSKPQLFRNVLSKHYKIIIIITRADGGEVDLEDCVG